MTAGERSDAVGRAHDDLYRLICDYGPGIAQGHFKRCDAIIAKLRRGLGLQTTEQHNDDRRNKFKSGVS